MTVLGLALSIFVPIAFAQGCSGPAGASDPISEEVAESLPAAVKAQEFDSSPYREVPPESLSAVEHDVPESLLREQAGLGMGAMRQGYRIQILSTRSKEEADLMSGKVLQWWIKERKQGNLAEVCPEVDGAPPVYQEFIEPYWRVRLGNFVERAHAQAVLVAVHTRFEGAFIAPARIPAK